MDEELEKNVDLNQGSEKKYKHISEKKKRFSVKKMSRFIFFIIVVVCVVILTNRTTQFLVDKHDEKTIRKIFAKMDEDKKLTNFYEKKRWDVDVVRETWRKDNNFLIRDTYDNGRVVDSYYIDNVYYIIRDVVDDINGVITKRVTKMTNAVQALPNPGLQNFYSSSENHEEDIKEWVRESKITSTEIDGIKCYQVYLKRANDTFFVDKSNNRVIREIKLYKENEDDDEIKVLDTGVVEVTVDSVTDENIALPDMSGYQISEYDVNKELEKRNSADNTQNSSETTADNDLELPVDINNTNQ